ncbi:MAG: hypothetical protein AVDCRST_MAG56-8024, partial [uncultured Cytophagales bacterium]
VPAPGRHPPFGGNSTSTWVAGANTRDGTAAVGVCTGGFLGHPL